MSEYHCKKYMFKRFSGISGFIAFDHEKASVGFENVCKYLDGLEEENKIAKEISRNLANYNMDLVEENKKLRATIELFIAKNIENEEKIAWMDDLRQCLKELDGEE